MSMLRAATRIGACRWGPAWRMRPHMAAVRAPPVANLSTKQTTQSHGAGPSAPAVAAETPESPPKTQKDAPAPPPPSADDEPLEDEYLTTIFEKMDPYMDTYEVYRQLTQSGFSPEQANELINLLVVQLNSKLSKLTTKYTQEYELDNERYLYQSAQQELRVDITRSRESHINELINLINILERDFNSITDELNNGLLMMKNNNQVTVNDQKQENTLQSKKIMLRIQETNHKITTELNSAMRSEIESLRWHLSRWGIISILCCVFSGCASVFIYKRRADKRTSKEFVPLVIYEPSEFDEDDYHTDLDKSVIQ